VRAADVQRVGGQAFSLRRFLGGPPAMRFAAQDYRIEYSYLFRRTSWQDLLLPNQAAHDGLQDAQSFDPSIPARARLYFDVLNEGLVSLYPRQFCLVRNWTSPLVGLMAVHAYIGPREVPSFPEIMSQEPTLTQEEFDAHWAQAVVGSLQETVAGDEPAQWLRTHIAVAREPTPRLVHRSRFVAVRDLEEAVPAVRALGDDIRECAVLELSGVQPGEYRLPESASPEIAEVAETPNSFEASVTAPPGWMILRDQILPGWRAWIDDAEVPIAPADILFRGVEWPGGTHRLVFRYEPASFRLGWFLSLVGMVMVVMGASRVRT
jgi:hypothetical protein